MSSVAELARSGTFAMLAAIAHSATFAAALLISGTFAFLALIADSATFAATFVYFAALLAAV